MNKVFLPFFMSTDRLYERATIARDTLAVVTLRQAFRLGEIYLKKGMKQREGVR